MGAGHEAHRERLVAGDRSVLAGSQLGRRHAHVRVGDFRRLAVGVAGEQRAAVGLGEVGHLAEALFDPVEGRLEVAVVEPVHEPEGEEVLGPLSVLGGEPQVIHGRDSRGGDRRFDDSEALKRAIRERIGRIASLLEVGVGERILVDDEQAAANQRVEVRLERRGVHRDQRVGLVARGKDLVLRERDLERANAGQRSRGRANFGREVRQRAEVVAEDGSGVGESIPSELHAVAGVSREAHSDAFALDNRGCDMGRRLRHQ